MSWPSTLDLDPFLQALFAEMRDVEMALSLEDYRLLRRSLEQSFGLGGWDDLKEVCELLWVKPSLNYSQERFEKAFERFRSCYKNQIPVQPKSQDTKEFELGMLPKIPPRSIPMSNTSPFLQQTLQAIDGGSLTEANSLKTSTRIYEPCKYPVGNQEIRLLGRIMRQWIHLGYDLELDLEGTIARIQAEGWWSDVVFRPVAFHRTELAILIDDSAAMRPFKWAFEPFLNASTSGDIGPVSLYWFTDLSQEKFYRSSNRRNAVPLANLLTHFHRDRTILLIWSDAGAALNQLDSSYINRVRHLLLKVSPCIRQVFWLNPLPKERWIDNSAYWIQGFVNGKMHTLASDFGVEMSKMRWLDPVSCL